MEERKHSGWASGGYMAPEERYGMRKHNTQYPKTSGNIIHGRVWVVYPHDLVGLTGGCSSLPLPLSPEGIIPHIANREKVKLRSTVSTQCVLLLHHHKVEKLRVESVGHHLHLAFRHIRESK